MYVIVAVILCLSVVHVAPSHHEIHKRMTKDEMQQVFGMTQSEDMPEYKLASIEVSEMEKRNTRFRRQIRIESPNKVMRFSFEHADGFLIGEKTPVTLAHREGNRIVYTDQPNMMRTVGRLLQDPTTRSSFVLSQNRNRRYAIDGYIESKNLMIRSLPEGLFDSSSNNSNLHVIYKPKKQPFQSEHPYELLNRAQLRMVSSENEQEIPSTIYPEILLILDSSNYLFHGSNLFHTIRYSMMLWNTIDMRYRNLNNPKVRLNIARIVIAKEPEGIPYIHSNMIDASSMHVDNVVEEAGKYFYSNQETFPLDSYDISAIMTQHRLVSPSGNQPDGVANLGPCLVDHYYQTVPRVAIFRDHRNYATEAPAHELGHALGAVHDELEINNENCTSSSGYIMSLTVASTNNWKFSSCSIRDMRNHTKHNPKCLYNKPKNAGIILPRIVGDKSMTIDKQCQLEKGTNACSPELVPEEDFCRSLSCIHPDNPHSCYIIPAGALAEGTPCGNGNKKCSRGECVSG